MTGFIKKILIFVILAAGLLAGYLSYGGFEPAENISWGVNFSPRYAEALGLDWRETYLKFLDELKVSRLRLVSYWSDIEKEEGNYDFTELDFLLDQARARNAKVILVVGRRQPRWPECHVPGWAQDRPLDEQNQAVLNLTKEVIKRYKNYENITAWQVENEFFVTWFGDCPAPEAEFLKAEINLVRLLDDRPIVLTDSGELSTWVRTAKYADILGVSMYRKVRSPWFGYVTYPIPPEYYLRHGNLIKWFSNFQKQIVTELQAEPWAEKTLAEDSVEVNYQSLDPAQFRKNIEYARRTGMDEIYLWGAEWWYFMKEKRGVSEFWDEARKLWN